MVVGNGGLFVHGSRDSSFDQPSLLLLLLLILMLLLLLLLVVPLSSCRSQKLNNSRETKKRR